MHQGVSFRVLALRVGLAVVAAVLMFVGSHALVGSGDEYALGEEGGSSQGGGQSHPAVDEGVRGTVVTRVRNAPELDPGIVVVTVPLDGRFASPGQLYGTRAKKPLQLGPAKVEGMTQDGLGSRAGILLPDGTRVIYSFWERITEFPTYAPGDPEVADGTHMDTPTIRLFDLVSSEDTLIASGARSMAWRADGAFAYATGIDTDYRLNLPYLERVVVQQGLDGEPSVWTSDADRYTVELWAGSTLIVSRELMGGAREYIALDGPDLKRSILSEADRESFLGVSPDGKHVLISSGGFDSGQPLMIREVELGSGEEIARFSFEHQLDPITGKPVDGVWEAAWEGDRIVVSLGSKSIAVLSSEGGALALEDIITFEYPKLRDGRLTTITLSTDCNRIYLVADEGDASSELERTAVITYDLASGECSRWIAPGMPAITHLVSNPSRPR